MSTTVTVEPYWEGFYRWFVVGLTKADRDHLLKSDAQDDWLRLIAMAKENGWDVKYGSVA